MPRKSSTPSSAEPVSKLRTRRRKAATRTPLPENPTSRPLTLQEFEARVRAILAHIQAA